MLVDDVLSCGRGLIPLCYWLKLLVIWYWSVDFLEAGIVTIGGQPRCCSREILARVRALFSVLVDI